MTDDDDDDDDENTPYAFFINEEEIVDHLFNVIQNQKLETEAVVPVVYQPQVCCQAARGRRRG